MEYQKPEYSMSFDDDNGKVVSGTDQTLNSLTQKVLQSIAAAPTITEMPDTYVKLPAGIIVDGEVVQDAEVQELTGEHEELLEKAKLSNNAAKYVNTLLNCGVVSIGDAKATPALLDSLIQGDLDSLIMGIRKATFGNTFQVFNVPCPSCESMNDLELDLNDVPVKKLEDPSVRVFDVKLRNGLTAQVQFPTGSVQNDIFKTQISVASMNNITLAFCVISFTDAAGNIKPSNGLADVKKLGLADRKTLQNFIYENQPGPRYDQVVAKCSSCEGEVPVPLNVGILFREL